MNCTFDAAVLSSYADGALNREKALDVARHLSGCDSCRRRLQELRAFGDLLFLLPREQAPDGLIERVLRSAAEELRQTAWRAARRLAGEMWRTSLRGFRIEDGREELLIRELPPWVLRWILFV